MLKELDSVVLVKDLPAHHLAAGDAGTVVLIHDGGAAYEVEFMTLDGKTVAVVTVPADAIRPARADEIAHARSMD